MPIRMLISTMISMIRMMHIIMNTMIIMHNIHYAYDCALNIMLITRIMSMRIIMRSMIIMPILVYAYY